MQCFPFVAFLINAKLPVRIWRKQLSRQQDTPPIIHQVQQQGIVVALMELHRGYCLICSDANKVLDSKECQQFLKIIPKLLGEELMSEREFQKQRGSMKLCPTCAHKLIDLNKIRKKFDEKSPKDKKERCRLCCTADDLVKVDTEWKRFQEKSEGICTFNDCKFLFVCVGCFFYIDTLSNIKTKIFHKYPQVRSVKVVASPKKSPPKPVNTPTQNGTPKRKGPALVSSPPTSSNKKRKIFDNCFTYLQALSTNVYRVDQKLRTDERLYRKIAYVKLFGQEQVSKGSKAHPHSKIKIKLKSPKQRRQFVTNKTKDENSIAKVKKRLSLPESSSSKSNSDVSNKRTKLSLRRHSASDESATTENVDETPKSIIKTPRRRPSLFSAPAIEEEATTNENGETETQPEDFTAKAIAGINEIVSKYIDHENAAKEAADEVINLIDDKPPTPTPQIPDTVEISSDVEEQSKDEKEDDGKETEKLENDGDLGENEQDENLTGTNEDRAITPSYSDTIEDISSANLDDDRQKDEEEPQTQPLSQNPEENPTGQTEENEGHQGGSIEKLTLDELYGDLKLDNENSDVNESESLTEDVEKKKKRVTFCDEVL